MNTASSVTKCTKLGDEVTTDLKAKIEKVDQLGHTVLILAYARNKKFQLSIWG